MLFRSLDRAFGLLTGKTRYGGAIAGGQAREWLAYARAMGRHRRLTSHPLNPKLFATQMVAEMPRS